MSTIRSILLATALATPLALHAQTFLTSFEAPTYPVNQSALGEYGWQASSLGYTGTSQTVTNARASDGSQSLLFNDAADSNQNALRETAYLGSSGTSTFSTDVWLAGNDGAGRVAELRFSTNYTADEVISIGGDGTDPCGNGGRLLPCRKHLRIHLRQHRLRQPWHLRRPLASHGNDEGFGERTDDGDDLRLRRRADVSPSRSPATRVPGRSSWPAPSTPRRRTRPGSSTSTTSTVRSTRLPSPASFAALGLGALAVLRRRRKV